MRRYQERDTGQQEKNDRRAKVMLENKDDKDDQTAEENRFLDHVEVRFEPRFQITAVSGDDQQDDDLREFRRLYRHLGNTDRQIDPGTRSGIVLSPAPAFP